MLQKLSVLCMLGICSFEDIRHKEIRSSVLVIFTIEGICGCLFLWKYPAISVLRALLPGIAMWVGACLTKGAIGEGDGMLVMIMSFFIAAGDVYRTVVYAVFISAFYALFLCVIKKKKKNYQIAFVPFLLFGYFGGCILTYLYM